MSTPPPSEYFPGINFNIAFYNAGGNFVTKDYVDSNFLKSTGYAVSRALSTTFNNIVYFNGGFQVIGNITVNGDISANNFKGSGAQLTSLNASNVTDGTLPVARGGTGSNTLTSGQLLIGNGLNPLTQTSNLSWSSNTLSAANITTSLLNSTDLITTNLNTTFMSGFKNTFYPLAFQNICSSTNLTKSVGADTDTVKTVYTTFGTHTLTATSVGATSSKIENIFDNNASTYWITSAATYTRLTVDANYTANSSFSMNVTSLGVVYGQSIKVRLPRRIYLSNVLYIPFSLPTSITNGYILGSTNDSTWEPVYPITKFLTNLNEVSLVPTGILPAIYNGSSKAYQYFMVIATSIQGTTGAPINSTEKFAITNLQFTLHDNWVYHDNIISIGNFPNGYPVSNALDINGNTYISGKILTDGGLNVLNGNVGIGLTNPNVSYKLDVSGNINALSYTVNGSQFNSSQWTTATDTTRIYYNTGNVGIGTTNPLARLHINYTSTALNPDVGITGLYVYNPTNSAGQNSVITNRIGGASAGRCMYSFDVNGAYGYSIKMEASSHALRFNNNWEGSGTDNMVINANGNVGIANTSPLGLLHLGDASKANNDGHIIFAKCTTLGSTRICRVGYNNSFDFVIGDTGAGNTLGGWAEQFKINYTAPANSLVISNTGVVSIGGTMSCANGRCSGDLEVGGNRFMLRGTSPTIYLRDTDNRSGMIHMNSNVMYFLNANGNDSETWTQQNGQNWALQLNMNNNDATFGGQITAYFVAVSQTDTDHVVVQLNYGSVGQGANLTLKVGFGSFTAFHRCYTDDELYNNDTQENIDLFKNNYMGRVVIATGKIKTDFSRTIESDPDTEAEIDGVTGLPREKEKKDEWYTGIDKDGISIEDAIPVVALSRKKKDKRVFGVLGAPKRNTNNPNRLIVNSVGEGAICVANTNGNIENGDYLQSSDLLGYGEKQDDDILHNYTIAKSTIDCNFELDSPYYQCHEIENGIRVAFIACSYHCG